jgi:peptide subunit release factor 1 (eRF1)
VCHGLKTNKNIAKLFFLFDTHQKKTKPQTSDAFVKKMASRELLEILQNATALVRGTTLITYLVSGRTQLSDIQTFLANERSTASSIKSGSVRKAVVSQLGTLSRAAQQLCKRGIAPDNGLVLLAGQVSVDSVPVALAPLAYV